MEGTDGPHTEAGGAPHFQYTRAADAPGRIGTWLLDLRQKLVQALQIGFGLVPLGFSWLIALYLLEIAPAPARGEVSWLPLQLAGLVLLNLLVMDIGCNWLTRLLMDQARRGEGILFRAHMTDSRKRLDGFGTKLGEALGEGEHPLQVWFSEGAHSPVHHVSLVSMSLVLGLMAIVLLAAVRSAEGLIGEVLGWALAGSLPVLFLLTPGYGGLSALISLGIPLILAFVVYPPILEPAPYLGLLLPQVALGIAALFMALRMWRASRDHLPDRVLVQSDRGWYLGSSSFFRKRLGPLRPLDPEAPVSVRRDEDGCHLTLPLVGEGTVSMTLGHRQEEEELARRAPPAWSALRDRHRERVPLFLPLRFTVYLLACLLATAPIVYGLEIGVGIIPALAPWMKGEPGLLFRSGQRITRLFPLGAAAHALTGAAAMEIGESRLALHHLERAHFLTQGTGSAGELAASYLGDPELSAYLEAGAALEEQPSPGSPPEGIPLEAWHAFRVAEGQRELLSRLRSENPLFPSLGLIRHLETARARSGGSYPDAERALARTLGRLVLPLDLSAPATLPATSGAQWPDRALELLGQDDAVLRARILFRAGRLVEAAPLLDASTDPVDRLRLASAQRAPTEYLADAPLELLRAAAPGARDQAPELLEALLLAESGQATQALRRLSQDSGHPLAPTLRLWIQALADPRAPLPPHPEGAFLPGERLPLPDWLLDTDLAILAELGPWSSLRKGPAWRGVEGLEAAAAEGALGSRALAQRLLERARTREAEKKQHSSTPRALELPGGSSEAG